jgi:hypothetical protein
MNGKKGVNMNYTDFAKQFCDEIEENHLENNGDVQDLYITEYLSHIDITDEEYEEEYDKVCFAIQQELNKRKGQA